MAKRKADQAEMFNSSIDVDTEVQALIAAENELKQALQRREDALNQKPGEIQQKIFSEANAAIATIEKKIAEINTRLGVNSPDQEALKRNLGECKAKLALLQDKLTACKSDVAVMTRRMEIVKDRRTDLLIDDKDTGEVDKEISELEKRIADAKAMAAALPDAIAKKEKQIAALQSKIRADYSNLQGIYVPPYACHTGAVPGIWFLD